MRSGLVVILTTLVVEGLQFESRGVIFCTPHECTSYGILAILTTLVVGQLAA
jgi:hypothetical protein